MTLLGGNRWWNLLCSILVLAGTAEGSSLTVDVQNLVNQLNATQQLIDADLSTFNEMTRTSDFLSFPERDFNLVQSKMNDAKALRVLILNAIKASQAEFDEVLTLPALGSLAKVVVEDLLAHQVSIWVSSTGVPSGKKSSLITYLTTEFPLSASRQERLSRLALLLNLYSNDFLTDSNLFNQISLNYYVNPVGVPASEWSDIRAKFLHFVHAASIFPHLYNFATAALLDSDSAVSEAALNALISARAEDYDQSVTNLLTNPNISSAQLITVYATILRDAMAGVYTDTTTIASVYSNLAAYRTTLNPLEPEHLSVDELLNFYDEWSIALDPVGEEDDGGSCNPVCNAEDTQGSGNTKHWLEFKNCSTWLPRAYDNQFLAHPSKAEFEYTVDNPQLYNEIEVRVTLENVTRLRGTTGNRDLLSCDSADMQLVVPETGGGDSCFTIDETKREKTPGCPDRIMGLKMTLVGGEVQKKCTFLVESFDMAGRGEVKISTSDDLNDLVLPLPLDTDGDKLPDRFEQGYPVFNPATLTFDRLDKCDPSSINSTADSLLDTEIDYRLYRLLYNANLPYPYYQTTTGDGTTIWGEYRGQVTSNGPRYAQGGLGPMQDLPARLIEMRPGVVQSHFVFPILKHAFLIDDNNLFPAFNRRGSQLDPLWATGIQYVRMNAGLDDPIAASMVTRNESHHPPGSINFNNNFPVNSPYADPDQQAATQIRPHVDNLNFDPASNTFAHFTPSLCPSGTPGLLYQKGAINNWIVGDPVTGRITFTMGDPIISNEETDEGFAENAADYYISANGENVGSATLLDFRDAVYNHELTHELANFDHQTKEFKYTFNFEDYRSGSYQWDFPGQPQFDIQTLVMNDLANSATQPEQGEKLYLLPNADPNLDPYFNVPLSVPGVSVYRVGYWAKLEFFVQSQRPFGQFMKAEDFIIGTSSYSAIFQALQSLQSEFDGHLQIEAVYFPPGAAYNITEGRGWIFIMYHAYSRPGIGSYLGLTLNKNRSEPTATVSAHMSEGSSLSDTHVNMLAPWTIHPDEDSYPNNDPSRPGCEIW